MNAPTTKRGRALCLFTLLALLLYANQLSGAPTTVEANNRDAPAFVLHATTLPARNEQFQAQLDSGLRAASMDSMPDSLRALATWSIQSGAQNMTTDDVIQQSFLALCEFQKKDDIRGLLLLMFLKQSLAVQPGNFAISLTRYLDFPDTAVREAALYTMDQEGVFALPATSLESMFPVVDVALPDKLNRADLPIPFLESMMNRDAVAAWGDIALRDPRSRGIVVPTTKENRQQHADGVKVEQVVFALRHDTYPFEEPPKPELDALLKELLKSEHWYSRLMVAHILKHHPRYVTEEIKASLKLDPCTVVRDLAGMISGTADGSMGNLVWPIQGPTTRAKNQIRAN